MPSKKTALSTKNASTLPTRTIKQAVIVKATPVEVYDAIVNAKKHAAFTGAAAQSSHKIGGKFTAWDGYISGKYLELVPGRKLLRSGAPTTGPTIIRLDYRVDF